MFQGKYISGRDLLVRLTKEHFLAVFDDEKTGDVNQVSDEILEQVIDSAEGEIDSYVITFNDLPLPAPITRQVDRLVKLAALDYAEALSFLRHPEYPRTFGENGKSKGLWTIAEKRMERLKKSLQQFPDIVSQRGLIPENTGGFVGNSDPDADDSEPRSKMFEDTGIF